MQSLTIVLSMATYFIVDTMRLGAFSFPFLSNVVPVDVQSL